MFNPIKFQSVCSANEMSGPVGNAITKYPQIRYETLFTAPKHSPIHNIYTFASITASAKYQTNYLDRAN